MKYCNQCGKQMQDEDRFCKECGSKTVGNKENIQVSEGVRATRSQKNGSGMKSKAVIGLIAVIVLVGGFYAIWSKWGQGSLEYGNTAGNLANYGLAAKKGDWVYYINASDGDKIYKILSDGTEKTKLNDDESVCINVVGDWIYYVNKSDNWKVYKMRTDGTERTKINEDNSACINVVGDWIYYSNVSDYYRIYKIHTDGTKRTKLNEENSICINVVGDWVYYIYSLEPYSGGSLYKMRTDGSEKKELIDVYSINVVDDWIYYTNFHGIYKMRTDGTEKTELYEGVSLDINVVGDWVYYNTAKSLELLYTADSLYKIRMDGTEKTKLSEDDSSSFNVVDDWVYYVNGSDDYKLYKMRTDGSERQIVD